MKREIVWIFRIYSYPLLLLLASLAWHEEIRVHAVHLGLRLAHRGFEFLHVEHHAPTPGTHTHNNSTFKTCTTKIIKYNIQYSKISLRDPSRIRPTSRMRPYFKNQPLCKPYKLTSVQQPPPSCDPLFTLQRRSHTGGFTVQ